VLSCCHCSASTLYHSVAVINLLSVKIHFAYLTYFILDINKNNNANMSQLAHIVWRLTSQVCFVNVLCQCCVLVELGPCGNVCCKFCHILYYDGNYCRPFSVTHNVVNLQHKTVINATITTIALTYDAMVTMTMTFAMTTTTSPSTTQGHFCHGTLDG